MDVRRIHFIVFYFQVNGRDAEGRTALHTLCVLRGGGNRDEFLALLACFLISNGADEACTPDAQGILPRMKDIPIQSLM